MYVDNFAASMKINPLQRPIICENEEFHFQKSSSGQSQKSQAVRPRSLISPNNDLTALEILNNSADPNLNISLLLSTNNVKSQEENSISQGTHAAADVKIQEIK